MILLALLSIYTLQRCRSADRQTGGPFLFAGRERIYSLASSVGSVFSVTYFFGATFIYGRLYGRGFLVLVTLAFGALAAILTLILKRMHAIVPVTTSRTFESNLALDFLKIRLPQNEFQRLLWLYAAIYFALLVEELAVSRLVFATLFPVHPTVPALLLVTIIAVIVIYLEYGGYQAVLTSDLEQLKVLVPFTLMLVLLVGLSVPLPAPSGAPSKLAEGSVVGQVGGMVFAIAWFAGGVDFYSRLNFKMAKGKNVLREQIRFSLTALALIYVLLVVGIFFGTHLSGVLPNIKSPTAYTDAAISYFLTRGFRTVIVVFLLSIFCMIFTTLNTLIITVLQVGAYTGPLLSARHVTRILVAATLVSTALQFDSVSAYGVFAGSLLIIPFCGLVHTLLRERAQSIWFLPKGLLYLPLGAMGAIIWFIIRFADLKLAFERHFELPGMVLCSTLLAAVSVRSYQLIARQERKHD